MELYLVQHGQATSKDEDAARPLTEGGREDVVRVARFAATAGVRPAAVYHSGKLRARQTAEILAAELWAGEASKAPGLLPNDDPAAAAGMLDSLDSPAMLVGHLPQLSGLCSLLVAGDSELQVVRFRTGGIVGLAKDESGTWGMNWMLTPDVIPRGSQPQNSP
jgi:phosphohistidine phosphatase